ncbi:unnamed protein product [Thlaspi arvense]|uniref:Uncharacterized protein n=1 Tax=Thlaspi arvense TaxID=13288 RepID=A0AAU9RU71_THLAR|nr:unnamed protein product [Thlaspi arvense]
MATATRLGRDLLFSSSSSTSKALRAATLKVRFADIIVKSKLKSADGMARIEREKLLLREKARIAAETRRALRLKQRRALEKMEREAKAEHHLVTEDEFVHLCGGPRLAGSRWLVRDLGLVLRTEDDDVYDDESPEKPKPEAFDDVEEERYSTDALTTRLDVIEHVACKLQELSMVPRIKFTLLQETPYELHLKCLKHEFGNAFGLR